MARLQYSRLTGNEVAEEDSTDTLLLIGTAIVQMDWLLIKKAAFLLALSKSSVQRVKRGIEYLHKFTQAKKNVQFLC